MARSTRDTVEIYRAKVLYTGYNSWGITSFYGPYDGPEGKSHAKRRIKDQFNRDSIIEAKVQKLEASLIYMGAGEYEAELEWVDVDD